MPATIDGGAQLLDARAILANQLDLQSGMSFADLGIGSSAHFLFPGAEIIGKNSKAYGIDILKAVLSAAESRAREAGLGNIQTVWTDLEVYGATKAIADNAIDRMTMVNLLYQTKQDEHVFNEVNRMLKPGGKIVIIDWLPNGASFGPPEAERTSLDKVRQMAQVVKWNEVATFPASDYHFGVVFQK